MRTKRVGLTGGIACGKTLISDHWHQNGIPCIDSDLSAHQLLSSNPAAIQEVVENFGTEVLAQSGGIDRRKLGALVFADPQKRAVLEAILHPKIEMEREHFFERLDQQGVQIGVGVVPLLYEVHLQERFDVIVVVASSPATQMERLVRKRNLSEAQAGLRLDAQWPVSRKMELGDHVVFNDGLKDSAIEQSNRILKRIKTSVQRMKEI